VGLIAYHRVSLCVFFFFFSFVFRALAVKKDIVGLTNSFRLWPALHTKRRSHPRPLPVRSSLLTFPFLIPHSFLRFLVSDLVPSPKEGSPREPRLSLHSHPSPMFPPLIPPSFPRMFPLLSFFLFSTPNQLAYLVTRLAVPRRTFCSRFGFSLKSLTRSKSESFFSSPFVPVIHFVIIVLQSPSSPIGFPS
jgi:hypothetical protein